jgi:hypothetical protein
MRGKIGGGKPRRYSKPWSSNTFPQDKSAEAR